LISHVNVVGNAHLTYILKFLYHEWLDLRNVDKSIFTWWAFIWIFDEVFINLR